MSNCAPLVRNWTYEASRPSALVHLLRLKSRLTGRVAPPERRPLRPVEARDRWNGLFLYAPDGRLSPAQEFAVDRIAGLRGASAVVCATDRLEDVPLDQFAKVDALYWKALPGFDFSAYALLLEEVARLSPGADLYLQNDSVLGPFGDVDALIDAMPWRVGGFMASSAVENHLQSYALFFRGVDRALVSRLAPVLSTHWAYDNWRNVVNLQETCLARVASRSESVGALWYAPGANAALPSLADVLRVKLGVGRADVLRSDDPSLRDATALLDQGFPFLKRSLFTRNLRFQSRDALDAFLAAQGHPPMEAM